MRGQWVSSAALPQVPATKTSHGRSWIPFVREPEMAIN